MRDPSFTLQAMGVRTAAEGVKGYYPAFDITPPHLVSGVVTDLGIYSPTICTAISPTGTSTSTTLWCGRGKTMKTITELRQEIVGSFPAGLS